MASVQNVLHVLVTMKTLLVLALCALVGCSYAAPVSDVSTKEALLRKAKAEWWGTDHPIHIPSKQRSFENKAQEQGDFGEKAKSKLLSALGKGAEGLLKVLSHPPVEAQEDDLEAYLEDGQLQSQLNGEAADDDEDDVSTIEALLRKAKAEWWGTEHPIHIPSKQLSFENKAQEQGDFGEKAKSKLLSALGKGAEGLLKVLSHPPVEAQEDDLEAYLEDGQLQSQLNGEAADDDEDDVSTIEALLRKAKAEWWGTEHPIHIPSKQLSFENKAQEQGDFGEKAKSKILSALGKGAEGLLKVLSHPPVEAQDEDDLEAYLEDGQLQSQLNGEATDDDEDDVSTIEALLRKAKAEWWGTEHPIHIPSKQLSFENKAQEQGDFGEKAKSKILSALGKGAEGLLKVLSHPPVEAQDEDDLEAYLEDGQLQSQLNGEAADDDEDDVSTIEALLRKAKAEWWGTEHPIHIPSKQLSFENKAQEQGDFAEKAKKKVLSALAKGAEVLLKLASHPPIAAQEQDDDYTAKLQDLLDEAAAQGRLEELIKNILLPTVRHTPSAQVQGKMGDKILPVLGKGAEILLKLASHPSVEAQNEDDDDFAALRDLLNDAEAQDWFSDLTNTVGNVVKKVSPIGGKIFDAVNSTVRKVVNKVAPIRGKVVNAINKTTNNVVKKVKQVGKKIVDTIKKKPSMIQNDDDDLAAIEALLETAKAEWWGTEHPIHTSKKAKAEGFRWPIMVSPAATKEDNDDGEVQGFFSKITNKFKNILRKDGQNTEDSDRADDDSLDSLQELLYALQAARR